MSIYAKTNMDAMPGSCTECKCGDRYGCVGDVKCRILQKYFTGNVEPPYKERPDECPLVEQLEPPNDPLTLEELREMDGEPVWITPSSFWALVIARPGERVKLISNDGEVVFADKEIELVGPVYRHKPEKGEENGKQS